MSFLLKLIRQEKDVIDLIECDPWKLLPSESLQHGEVASPKYIRVEKYLYKFYNHRNDPNHVPNHPYFERESKVSMC